MTPIGESNLSDPLSEQPNVQTVLQQLQSGDCDAASQLHVRFVDRLVRLASSRINQRFRSKIEPEEVVQSVFASFFRRHELGQFQFEDWNDLWALLVQITVRKCARKVNCFMTAKRNVDREFAEGGNEHGAQEVTYRVEPTAEEIAVFNETLDKLFDKLSADQQEIVCLRLKGLSNLEISQRIGRTERTVYRHLNSVRDIFRDSLNEVN